MTIDFQGERLTSVELRSTPRQVARELVELHRSCVSETKGQDGRSARVARGFRGGPVEVGQCESSRCVTAGVIDAESQSSRSATCGGGEKHRCEDRSRYFRLEIISPRTPASVFAALDSLTTRELRLRAHGSTTTQSGSGLG